ncbi:MAG: VOC family protein [Gammaproteobacteria bacterium]|nr:MAG: VOC family protein [Gammaproteobacteria bacterium]
MQTSTHLHFNGNCREAFDFYARTFGGKIVFSMTYGESPGAEKTSPESGNKIIHARIDFGGQCLLGCDTPAEHYHTPEGFNVMAAVEQPAEAERIFATLADGGQVTMAVQETFWAHRFGMVTDRFGTPWMVNCAKPLGAVTAAARKSA